MVVDISYERIGASTALIDVSLVDSRPIRWPEMNRHARRPEDTVQLL